MAAWLVRDLSFGVRSLRKTPGSTATAAQVYAIDPNQPVMDVRSLGAALRTFEYATPRFNLTLLAVLAGCGLVLAIVGVYRVMSTAVAQQRHEIGVRMALGATSGSIARLVLAGGAGLVAVGLALGPIDPLVALRDE